MDIRPIKSLKLPDPFTTGGLPLAESISMRRSMRDFSPEPILLFQLSQILWAAQGITSVSGKMRSIPSAGATFPLEVYVMIGEDSLENVDAGLFHYETEAHVLSLLFAGDIRAEIASAAMGQDFIAVAPLSLIICAINDRTMIRYNVRGERYVFMEAGHAGQNIYLQTTALGLGTVAIGAFKDDEIRRILRLEPKTRPLYIMPVGKRAG